jgi:hypothetical protein
MSVRTEIYAELMLNVLTLTVAINATVRMVMKK